MHNIEYLFNKKDLYLAQFAYGKNASTTIPPKGNLLFPGENLHLIKDFTFTVTNGFPQLEAYNGSIAYEYVPYISRKKYKGNSGAIHFFLYDQRFNGIWNRLDARTYELADYKLLLTPDFSLGVDVPDFCNKMHLYQTRFVGAYWQQCGYDVLPTASWGNVDSFKYCFEGLPEESTIAVSGVGHRQSQAHWELWQMGLRELELQKHPTRIVIYGDEEEVPNLHTPLSFISSFISQRLRK